ncbi:HIRAN domain-containing protein [Devosia sp. RR2S18]|uniref:HIRAN domain-containing protein n=1 Tax=Devosia rhizosphaerae TaxID=3049774 RepID=UPI002541121D|nr:HIRAN domain-containing protein [Devosia sp. RR2S18]WIJ25196.1 HIRAN domain-containing protein [Devosia sp. RR2S18]
MFRRAFLAGGAGLLATAPALAAAVPGGSSAKLHPLARSYLTSVQADAVRRLTPGTPLTLQRDPSRRFEPATAVAVLAGDQHLGYLPGNAGKLVAPLLDSGALALVGEVSKVRQGDRLAADLNIYIELA